MSLLYIYFFIHLFMHLFICSIYIYIYIWHGFTYRCKAILYSYRYIYIYNTIKTKVRKPSRIPNISPPQLECGTRTAKNHSVKMTPHPGFKFFVVFGKPFAQIPHLECLHTISSDVRMQLECFPLELAFYQHFSN